MQDVFLRWWPLHLWWWPTATTSTLNVLSPTSVTVAFASVNSHRHDVTNVGYVISTCLKTMFSIIVHGVVNVSEINFVGSEPEILPLGLRKFRTETRFWSTRSFRNFQRHLYNQRLLQHLLRSSSSSSNQLESWQAAASIQCQFNNVCKLILFRNPSVLFWK